MADEKWPVKSVISAATLEAETFSNGMCQSDILFVLNNPDENNEKSIDHSKDHEYH